MQCMCGDPYCGSCGNPDLARWEEWCDRFYDILESLGLSEEEAEYVESVVPVLINAHRDAQSKHIKMNSEPF